MGESDDEIEIAEEEQKVSCTQLNHVDSLNLEAGRVSFPPTRTSNKVDWSKTLRLAFQSIGIVYGDIGTSPLYVYTTIFNDGIHNKDDIIGVLSLIIFTILLEPVIKYILIVLWANDNGDGGTFALYSLICRYAKVSLIPNQQPEDRELSNYRLDLPSKQMKRAYKIKSKLENSRIARVLLFLVTILGTSMVIGDGVLTPSISILSAVSGIDSLGKDAVVGVSVAILIILFSVQRFGTDKVGYSFAPIIFLWFTFITSIGLYNLFKHDLGVLRAFYPKYMIDYFRRNGKKGWISLGGVVLCITGTEAMFADLGHFNVRAIQISFSGIVLPALLAAYSGQAAYLRKYPEQVHNTFYNSIPNSFYWPSFVVAVAAAIIASQAIISGAFSIVSQSLSLGCFPRVKVIHTSSNYEGQVYIPEINYILMIACVIVTLSFKTMEKIGHAYGIAVVSVMVITTCMVTLIMLVIWKTNIRWIIMFFVVFISMETVYLSSVLYKFVQGGYLPLAFSFILMIIMGIWHYVHEERYMFELRNKISSEFFQELVTNPNVKRVQGMALLYSELVQGIPLIFPHLISNLSSIHSLLVLVSIKTILISRVAMEERFLFREIDSREFGMFRCVVRYGYKDKIMEHEEFEHQLMEHLKMFMDEISKGSSSNVENIDELEIESSQSEEKSTESPRRIITRHNQKREAMEKGVVYLMGEVEVVAKQNSSLIKKIVVNYAYNFLRKNFRQAEKVLAIPRTRLVRVGMTYEI